MIFAAQQIWVRYKLAVEPKMESAVGNHPQVIGQYISLAFCCEAAEILIKHKLNTPPVLLSTHQWKDSTSLFAQVGEAFFPQANHI